MRLKLNLNMKKIYNRLAIVLAAYTISGPAWDSSAGELKDSTKIFYLGEIVVLGTPDGTGVPFRQARVTRDRIDDHHLIDASRALNALPGLSLANAGSRNESMVYIRGFDLRQVPVFLDGIPEYVPYDGYLDLARFITSELSEITVAKGFSSVLYGANALGGAINLITKKPETPLDWSGEAGVMSGGGGYKYSVQAGTRQSGYYLDGSYGGLKRNSYPLSKSFSPGPGENGGERDNSYREDSRYAFKAGLTPVGSDEYTFSFVNQQGDKGNPVYSGTNQSVIPRYWRWPDWDKISQYAITKTTFGDGGSDHNFTVKTRLFHDKFKNSVFSYDDATYSSQAKKSSFRSYYNDDVWGAVVEGSTRSVRDHRLSLSLHWKHDIHREHNSGEPERTMRDVTLSLGAEDVYRALERVSFVFGVMYGRRKSLQAQDYDARLKTISDFPFGYSDAWDLQAGAIISVSTRREIALSVARKTRFSTMKDRYSYKLGTAIPNPGLTPEIAVNYDLSYRDGPADWFVYNLGIFYNDLHDVIQQVTNAPGNLYQMRNLGRARYFGGEAEISLKPLASVGLDLNYTLLRRENISNRSVRFLDTPDHKVIVDLSASVLPELALSAYLEYNSRRFSSSDGIFASGPFTLCHAGFWIAPLKFLEVRVGVNNLFDRNYSIAEGYPEEGRSGYLTLRFHN